MVQYKPEAVDIFEQFQDEFNATHDDIYLKIDSPNDAMTILKIFAEYKKDTEYVQYLEETQKTFGEKVQELCWDHDRFVRGYTEAGERIGEAAAPEANLWLNPQSWAVISGLASPEQGDAALNNVYERLNTKYGAILMDPPYHAHAFDGALAAIYNQGTKENSGIFSQIPGLADSC